jgi:hypothetical protein
MIERIHILEDRPLSPLSASDSLFWDVNGGPT